jgi:hypothetical protein
LEKRLWLGMVGCLLVMLIVGGCATTTGIIIGNLVDSSTSELNTLDKNSIKFVDWHMPLELVLIDSTRLSGKFEGIVESDAGSANDSKFPFRDEIIAIYFTSGPIQKFRFKSYYYQLSNHEYGPIFRLGTTGDDFNLRLRDVLSIIRANGDSVSSDSISAVLESSDFSKRCFVLKNKIKTDIVPIKTISRVKQIKHTNGVLFGLLAGVMIDIALYTSFTNAMKHME